MKFSSCILFSLFFLAACQETPPQEGTPPGGSTTVPSVPSTGTNETSGSGVDPLASYAWHLQNTGQNSFSSSAGVAGEDLKILSANNLGYTGHGVRIAVSDSGVEVTHPDLAGNQLSGEHRSYVSNSSSSWHGADPFPIEYEGHGTAVAGLIGALANNGIGSRGVAPDAHFAGFLFLGEFHTSQTSYEAKVLDQLTGDFDIFNYSYGYAGCDFFPASSSVISAYKAGVTNLRGGKGAIYVKAAGNEYQGSNSDCRSSDMSGFFGNTNTSEEQNHPYLIMVAAANASGKISSYSTPGSGVWVTGAGGEFGSNSPAMVTTDITGCSAGLSTSSSSNSFNRGGNLNSDCNYTSIMNGTSSAAPTLSGIIALMLEANPDLGWRDVKDILARTSDKIQYSVNAMAHPGGSQAALSGHVYDYVYVKNAAGFDFSNTYGFGRANALAAVGLAKNYDFPMGVYKESPWVSAGSPNLAIPDRSSSGVTHSVNVSQNYKIESVQLKWSTDHTYVGDLGVELVSPSGTRSKLLLVNSNINHSGLSDYVMLSNAFYGESSQGPWSIKVIDGASQDTGKLISWSLKINGH